MRYCIVRHAGFLLGQGHGYAAGDPAVSLSRPEAIKSCSMPAQPNDSKSVLLVKDNKDVAEGVAELLRLHGVRVRVAYDGASAMKSALNSVPELILCDPGLP